MKTIKVSGILTPDATGFYREYGVYNDEPYYRRMDGGYFIWWNDISNWIITLALGEFGTLSWQRNSTDICGEYQSFGSCDGIATVSFVDFFRPREDYLGFRHRN